VEGNVKRHIVKYHPAVNRDWVRLANEDTGNDEASVNDIVNSTAENNRKEDDIEPTGRQSSDISMMDSNGMMRVAENDNFVNLDKLRDNEPLFVENVFVDLHVAQTSTSVASVKGADGETVTEQNNGVEGNDLMHCFDGGKNENIGLVTTEKMGIPIINDGKLSIKTERKKKVQKINEVRNFGKVSNLVLEAKIGKFEQKNEESLVRETLVDFQRNTGQSNLEMSIKIVNKNSVNKLEDKVSNHLDVEIKKEISDEGIFEGMEESLSVRIDEVNEGMSNRTNRTHDIELQGLKINEQTERPTSRIVMSNNSKFEIKGRTQTPEIVVCKSEIIANDMSVNDGVLKCEDSICKSSTVEDVTIEYCKSPLGVTTRTCLSCGKSYTRYGDMNKHTMRWHSRRLKDCIITKKPQCRVVEQSDTGKADVNKEAADTSLTGIVSPILSSMLTLESVSDLRTTRQLMTIPPAIISFNRNPPMKCAHCPFSSHRIKEIRHHLAGAVKNVYPCRHRPGDIPPPYTDARSLVIESAVPASKTGYLILSPVETSSPPGTESGYIFIQPSKRGTEIDQVAIQPKESAIRTKTRCLVVQPKHLVARTKTGCLVMKRKEPLNTTEPPVMCHSVIVEKTDRKKLIVKFAVKPAVNKAVFDSDNLFEDKIRDLKLLNKPLMASSDSPRASLSDSAISSIKSLLLRPSSMSAASNDHDMYTSSELRGSPEVHKAVDCDLTLEDMIKGDLVCNGQRLRDGLSDRGMDDIGHVGRDEESVEYLMSLMCNVCGYIGDTPAGVQHHSEGHVPRKVRITNIYHF